MISRKLSEEPKRQQFYVLLGSRRKKRRVNIGEVLILFQNQRLQVHSVCGVLIRETIDGMILEPRTSNMGYFDPLGKQNVAQRANLMKGCQATYPSATAVHMSTSKF